MTKKTGLLKENKVNIPKESEATKKTQLEYTPVEIKQRTVGDFQAPDFIKSTINLLITILLILIIVLGSLLAAGQVNLQKDTQAKFAKINQELADLKPKLNKNNLQNSKPNPNPAVNPNLTGIEKPVLSYDNISGNPSNRFTLVVYVDMQCPFCKIMHENLSRLQSQIPNLTIVYRHYPIEELHQNALTLAKATECAKKIGGQEDFWRLTNAIIANQTALQKPDGLIKIINSLKMDKIAIEKCVSNNETLERVKYDQNEAYSKLGSKNLGTPTSILFDKDKEIELINGALPYPELKNIIQKNLR